MIRGRTLASAGTASAPGLLHRHVGRVVRGDGLGVLDPHHEDDADCDEGEAGEDGDHDDEDRGYDQLPGLALPAGVSHDLLGRGLLEGEGVEGDGLADPFAVCRPDREDVAVTRHEPGQKELCQAVLHVEDTGSGLGIPQIQFKQLFESSVKTRAARDLHCSKCLVEHSAIVDGVGRPRRNDVVSAGPSLHPDAVLPPAQQVSVVQLGPAKVN